LAVAAEQPPTVMFETRISFPRWRLKRFITGVLTLTATGFDAGIWAGAVYVADPLPGSVLVTVPTALLPPATPFALQGPRVALSI
jgi:hypothetical protein